MHNLKQQQDHQDKYLSLGGRTIAPSNPSILKFVDLISSSHSFNSYLWGL